jgi:hypothetical protein
VVVDLGSGGGFDVFVAAQKVGAQGRAIGIDMNQVRESFPCETSWMQRRPDIA